MVSEIRINDTEGTEQAFHTVVPDDTTIGGIMMVHRRAIAAAAKGDNDIVLPAKERVIDAWIICTANNSTGAGETVQIKSTASTITDAMDGTGTDKAVVRAGEINDTNHEIPANGILRITTAATGANSGAYDVYVLTIRVL